MVKMSKVGNNLKYVKCMRVEVRNRFKKLNG